MRFSGSETRVRLMRGLEDGLRCLHIAGCRTVYVDGSFVTSKSAPGDFDVCFEVTNETSFDALSTGPESVENFSLSRAVQKQRYGGEFLVASSDLIAAYLTFFQIDKSNRPKGVVRLDLTDAFALQPNEGNQ